MKLKCLNPEPKEQRVSDNRELMQKGLIALIEDAMQASYSLYGVTDTYNALCVALSEAKKAKEKEVLK